MSEIIELTDTARLVVEYDDSPECPRGDWHMLTGFVKIPGRGDSRLSDVPAVHDDPGIGWAHENFPNEELVERFFRIFHGLHVEYDAEHGGYWFVAGADAAAYATPVDTYSRALFRDNWPDLEPGSPESLAKQAEVIRQEQETYRQWADGEVYGVILERAAPWEKTFVNSGDTVEGVDWVEHTSIWGSYLDDDYTAQVVADEYFDLTDEERDALGLKVTERRETPAEASTGVSGEW